MEKWVLWMCAVDIIPTIDTSHTRAAHLPRIATQLSISGNGHMVSQLLYLRSIAHLWWKSQETYGLSAFYSLLDDIS
ncbi:hypothetical protein SFRURICE_006453 [Spodoptera frugiperda]|nr:hypothetical protein SFRURICE_006453 [Spodoptera frugiperda]